MEKLRHLLTLTGSVARATIAVVEEANKTTKTKLSAKTATATGTPAKA